MTFFLKTSQNIATDKFSDEIEKHQTSYIAYMILCNLIPMISDQYPEEGIPVSDTHKIDYIAYMAGGQIYVIQGDMTTTEIYR